MRTSFTISLKRSTLIFRYPQAGRPITPSIEVLADSICSIRAFQLMTRRALEFSHGQDPSPT